MDATFILPTVRGPEYYQRVIDQINAVDTKYEKEILVVSPNKVVGEWVIWIPEEVRLGPTRAFNYACKYAKGEYVYIVTDDSNISPEWPAAIDYLKDCNRKYKVVAINPGDQTCYLPTRGDRLGSVLRLAEDIPRYTVMRYPVFARETIQRHLNGFIWHPEFYYHAVDMWLGYWLGVMGEPGEEIRLTPGPNDGLPNAKNSFWEVADCNTFYALVKNFQAGCRDYVHIDESIRNRCAFD